MGHIVKKNLFQNKHVIKERENKFGKEEDYNYAKGGHDEQN